MNTIETLFVPYELAVKLKTLGFDEECFRYYLQDKRTITYEEKRAMPKQTENCIGSPTYSAAFRWFREKYGDYLLHSFGVIPHFTIIQNLIFEDSKITYEEAEVSCLTKLIEIVEQQNQK